MDRDRTLRAQAARRERKARMAADDAAYEARAHAEDVATEEPEPRAPEIASTAGACTYCGEPATENDHLLPLPWTGKAARRSTKKVPACRECNGRLSDLFLPTVEERAAHLFQVLAEEHLDELGKPDWSPRELEALGDRLRQAVITRQADRTILRSRLAWLKLTALGRLP